MKKKKLLLTRETLRHLDLRRVTGGAADITPSGDIGHSFTSAPDAHSFTSAPDAHSFTSAPFGHSFTSAPRGHSFSSAPF